MLHAVQQQTIEMMASGERKKLHRKLLFRTPVQIVKFVRWVSADTGQMKRAMYCCRLLTEFSEFDPIIRIVVMEIFAKLFCIVWKNRQMNGNLYSRPQNLPSCRKNDVNFLDGGASSVNVEYMNYFLLVRLIFGKSTFKID